MKTITPSDITVVILAGGKGRRMGGQDKGLLDYQDKPLISHVLQAMSLQTNQIMINANRNRAEYESYGYPVIEDTLNDYQGPLAGFLASMSAVDTAAILTLPCDGPIIDEQYLRSMLAAINASNADIAVAYDGERIQPVYALISTGLIQSLSFFLEQGGRRIDEWYNSQHTVKADFSANRAFFTNMNRPEDLSNNE